MNDLYIIAEAEINHNGDFDTAKKMIQVAKECGANCVKFQYIIADEIADPGSKFYDLFKNAELSADEFSALRRFAADEVNIDLMMTVPSVKTTTLARELGFDKIKVGSSNLTNTILLREIAKHKNDIEIFLSTGMGNLADIELALKALDYQPGDENYHLLHCTVNYPAEFENLNLSAISTMHSAFPGLNTGYSDHTQSPLAGVVALSLGATIFEKHFTLDNEMPGPDHFFSSDPVAFKEFADALRNAKVALGSPRKQAASSESQMLKNARRFLVLNQDVPTGTQFKSEYFATKRVGEAPSPVEVKEIDTIELLKAPKDYQVGDILNWTDFNQE